VIRAMETIKRIALLLLLFSCTIMGDFQSFFVQYEFARAGKY
jgi:hypothetical protein